MNLGKSLLVLALTFNQILSKYYDEVGVGDWHKVLVGLPLQVKSLTQDQFLVRTDLDNIAQINSKDGSVGWRVAGKTKQEKLREFELVDEQRFYVIFDNYLRIYFENSLLFDYQLPSTTNLPKLKFSETFVYLIYSDQVKKLTIGKFKPIWTFKFTDPSPIVNSFLSRNELTIVSNLNPNFKLTELDVAKGSLINQTKVPNVGHLGEVHFTSTEGKLDLIYYRTDEKRLTNLKGETVYQVEPDCNLIKIQPDIQRKNQFYVHVASSTSFEIHLIDVSTTPATLITNTLATAEDFLVSKGAVVQSGFEGEKVWITNDGNQAYLPLKVEVSSHGPITQVLPIDGASALVITKDHTVHFTSQPNELVGWTRDEYLVNSTSAVFLDYEGGTVEDRNQLILLWDPHHVTVFDFQGQVLARKYVEDWILDLKVVESSHRSQLVLALQGSEHYLLRFEDALRLHRGVSVKLGANFDHLQVLHRQLLAVNQDQSIQILATQAQAQANLVLPEVHLYHCELKSGTQLYGYQIQTQGNQVGLQLRWLRNLTTYRSEDPVQLVYNSGSKLASLGVVQRDRTVRYKYLNPNLAVVVSRTSYTTSSVQVLDLITGTSLLHYHLEGTDVLAALQHNVLVYYYFDSKVNVPILTRVELYHSEYPDLKPEGLVQGTSSAFDVVIPYTQVKSSVLAFPIVSLAFTRSPLGVSPTQLLVTVFPTFQILLLDLNYFQPTHFLPTKESNPNLILYRPTSILTYKLPVVGLTKLTTGFGTHYESQSSFLAFGQDIFFSTHAQQPFDHLPPNFSKQGLLATTFALALALFIVHPTVKQRRLQEAWY